MTLGVTENDALMLSLTTVNGRPVQAQSGAALLTDSQDLAYQPSDAQVREINSLIGSRKRHPIIEMRQMANRALRSSSNGSSSPSKQVIRSITFFNSD